MANRNDVLIDNLLNNTQEVYNFYTRKNIKDQFLTASSRSIVVDEISEYFRISQYSLFDETPKNSDRIKKLSSELLGIGNNLSVTISSDKGTISVVIGASNKILTQNALNAKLNNIIFENIKTVPYSAQIFNGAILIDSEINISSIDDLISTMGKSSYTFSVVCSKCSNENIYACKDQINEQIKAYSPYINLEDKLRLDAHHMSTNNIVRILCEKLKTKYEELENSVYKVWIIISAEDNITYRQLAQTTKSIMNANSDFSPILVSFRHQVFDGKHFILPDAFLGEINYGGLFSNTLCNIINVKTAASFVTLPYYSHSGFKVIHAGDSKIDYGPFDKIAPPISVDSRKFLFGNLDTGTPYFFPIDALRQHVFITGTTQYGKTTSIKRLLFESKRNDVNFIVVEAAKKEYWDLLTYPLMRDLKVYSCGMDANILYINPFQPENNTMLDSHIQNLIHAFITMFDEGSPIPEVISELVYKCYAKKGWGDKEVSQIISAYDFEDAYPTLQDMIDNIEEVVDEIGYSKSNSEVRDNICGAVRIRLKSLMKGSSNICLNSGKNISIAEMYRTSTIIELDDLSPKNKNFISSIIAMKVSEFSRQCEYSTILNRLLVLEEAHHIISNTELSSVSRNALNCSKYFTDILAEISAYGTGVVIIDQRPSAVSSASIANTGTKIIHSLKEGSDINSIADALSLQYYEKPLISKLKIGQAIVIIPSAPEMCLVNIDRISETYNMFHVGCLFCNKKKCDYEANKFEFRKTSLDTLNRFVSSRKGAEGSIIQILQQYDIPHNDYLCAAGYLLKSCDLNNLTQRQIIFSIFNKIGG